MLRWWFVSIRFLKCGHQIGRKQPFDQKVRVHPSPKPFPFECCCWCCWCLTRSETKGTDTQTDCVVHSFHSEGNVLFRNILISGARCCCFPWVFHQWKERECQVSCRGHQCQANTISGRDNTVKRGELAPMSYLKKTNKKIPFTPTALIWLLIRFIIQSNTE